LGKAELLQQIKEAEERVRQMVKEAEGRRKQLQAEGKRRAIENTEHAEAKLREHLDSEMAAARATIDKRKQAILERGAAKAEELTAAARKNLAQAQEFVLTEFERAVDV
jgi:vacuolar-type H+-ATPase subunit H